MFQCPQCHIHFPSQPALSEHMYREHRGMGWYEDPTKILDTNTGTVKLKAIDHALAKKKEELQKRPPPITTPILASKPQLEPLTPLNGWHKLSDNSFIFEQEICKHNTPFDTTIITLEGRLNSKHGTCTEHKYVKDLTELEDLKQKEVFLDSKLSSYTPSDPQFKEIAKQLYDTKEYIKQFNRNVKPDEVHTLIFEDYYRFEPGNDEHNTWMKNFMSKVNEEYDRLKNSETNNYK